MKLKFIKPDDFINYKKCSLFLGVTSCNWKCCKEQNLPCSICQNYPWSNNLIKEFSNEELKNYYLQDDLEEAIVFGGLEPFLQWDELYQFIYEFRNNYNIDDDIVIYTGYNENEIADKIEKLKEFKNIIVKFGRYIPNKPSRYDEILGVTLASDNQYAKRIS